MKLTITEVSPEQFKELITEGREPLATDAAPSTAEWRVAEWIEAALRRYPMNSAFDATNPALVIDNIISGATAEAWNKSGEVESLFSVTMKEIHDEAEGALRYPQVCDAQTAVRRLAVRSKELEAQLAEAQAGTAQKIAHDDAVKLYAETEGENAALRVRVEQAEARAADLAKALKVYANRSMWVKYERDGEDTASIFIGNEAGLEDGVLCDGWRFAQTALRKSEGE